MGVLQPLAVGHGLCDCERPLRGNPVFPWNLYRRFVQLVGAGDAFVLEQGEQNASGGARPEAEPIRNGEIRLELDTSVCYVYV